ncbi:MAG: hypothetical protein II422_06545, partial [Prevotella sp.]|nr:hypothetical protein [Prevotella sp.]
QMAESVDALVSNTSGATHPGSIPGLGTKSLQKQQSAAGFPLAALFLFIRNSNNQLKSKKNKQKTCYYQIKTIYLPKNL